MTIEDDILRAAKSLAVLEEKTIGQVISELARRGLRPAQPQRSAAGIPHFDVAADVAPLTPEMVRQALDD